MAGKRIRLSAASCPKCGERGTLKEIIYGMPGPDFDHNEYIVGGCVISASDPEFGCSICGWEGARFKQ